MHAILGSTTPTKAAGGLMSREERRRGGGDTISGFCHIDDAAFSGLGGNNKEACDGNIFPIVGAAVPLPPTWRAHGV